MKLDAGGQLNKAGGSALNFVPRLNLVANINEKFYAKLMYGQAFRSPALVERYLNSKVVHSGFVPPLVGGGSTLSPETITTAEFQLAYKFSTVQLTATYFNSQQNDIIGNSSPSDSLVIANAGQIGKKLFAPKKINNGSLASQGIELEGKATASKNLYVTTSLSLFDVEKGKPQGIPTMMFKLGITYELRKLGLQTGLFNSYYNAGDAITVRYPTANPAVAAYNLMTLNVNWDMKKLYTGRKPDVLISLFVDNLLDEAVYYPELQRRVINSIPGRSGRGFYVSVKVGF